MHVPYLCCCWYTCCSTIHDMIPVEICIVLFKLYIGIVNQVTRYTFTVSLKPSNYADYLEMYSVFQVCDTCMQGHATLL